jgi:hypothetical protein
MVLVEAECIGLDCDCVAAVGGEEKCYTWQILIWRENRRTDVPHVVFVLAGNHQYRPSAGKQ